MQTPSAMTQRNFKSVLALIMMLAMTTLAFAQTRPESRVALTKEERDRVKMNELKEIKNILTPKACLKFAQNMEYSISAEEVRQFCLSDLKKKPTPLECLQITRAMEFADTADQARWTCLLRMNYMLTKKLCLTFAEEMQYPGNSSRAKAYCSSDR